jgi:hypothetical protein
LPNASIFLSGLQALAPLCMCWCVIFLVMNHVNVAIILFTRSTYFKKTSKVNVNHVKLNVLLIKQAKWSCIRTTHLWIVRIDAIQKANMRKLEQELAHILETHCSQPALQPKNCELPSVHHYSFLFLPLCFNANTIYSIIWITI